MNKFSRFYENCILGRRIRLLLTFLFLFLGLFSNIKYVIYAYEKNYLGTFSVVEIMSYSFSFPVLPTYVLLLFIFSASDIYLKELQVFKVIRFFSREQLKNIIVGNLLYFSILFVFISFIFNFGITVSMVGLAQSFFSISTFIWFVVNFIFLVLCFFIVGMLVTVIGLVFRNLFIGIIVSSILPLIDMYSPISFIFKQATININHVVGTMNVIYMLLYLLVISYLLISVLRKLVNKYDFY
ncbi:hypothetical protein [Bacillus thuringiensis]|uniref:hypothetical protein n=1 Tax=Bacillus thuringiensis TaxID=1428 RepID=UPI000BF8C251|nr:hypothetical protein [Bacillus thuringiensis]PER38953.1 hypothetical protein CN472_30935 [Bacillus thuringiensis]